MASTSITETKVYDLYASILNFKKQIVTLKRPFVSASWIPEVHQRRIKAYDILHAYYECYSRDFRMSPEGGTNDKNDTIKEVGTPSWICDKIKNKLLGGQVSINIPTPRRLSNVDQQLEALLSGQSQDTEKKGILEQKKREKELLTEREGFLQDWFTENMIYLKIDENERLCSYLGDCAYMVYWDNEDKCPKIETYDPGFVFPDYDTEDKLSWQDASSEVKDRVCISWQEEIESQENFKVYREVYELRVATDGAKRCFRHAAYFMVPAGSESTLWDLEKEIIQGSEEPWTDLGIEFIPIIIVPNIQIQGNAFGQSNIAKILPLFDSIMNSETDLAANGEKLGGATVFVSGADAKPRKDTSGNPISIKVQSNSLYSLGESGRMDLLDTSTMQTALLATLNRYDNKLIELSEITKIVAGQSEPGQIPSGIALKILLQPLLDKINPMRQQRQAHYSILFYYVQRFFQINGSPEEKKLFPVGSKLYDIYLQYGEIIPAEKKAQLEEYKAEMEILDEQTVFEQMKADGYPIDIKTVMDRKTKQRQQQTEANASLFNFQRSVDTGIEQTPEEKAAAAAKNQSAGAGGQ